jgi:hypothetical protein
VRSLCRSGMMSNSAGAGMAGAVGCGGRDGVAAPVGGWDARAELGTKGVAGPDILYRSP